MVITAIRTYSRVDPSRTKTIRDAFVREFRRRFHRITVDIRKMVDTEDVFGLRGATTYDTPGAGMFAFPRSQDKITAFMQWLEDQIDRGLLEIREYGQVGTAVEGAWTNKYVYDSYKRGVIRARYELKKAGFNIPSIQETGGIEISMGTPFHVDRLGLLYTRVFSELKGITAQMDQQISRVLAQGLADGDNPRLLARKLVSTINGVGMGDLGLTDTLGRFIPARRRAEIMARTEVVRAHHQANIQEYQNWGAEGVRVQAEWQTAGDERVCDICQSLQGSVWTLREIESMIPVHPQCRCVALPFRPGRDTPQEWNEMWAVKQGQLKPI